jgi:hypothetical protein
VAVDPQWLRETRHKNQLSVGLASNNGHRHPVGMGLGGLGIYTEDISSSVRARNATLARRAAEAREDKLAAAAAALRKDQVVLPLPAPTNLPRYLMYGAIAVAVIGVVGTIIRRRSA